eukprot:TRINITY_DN61148_c0_g1_i1.p1 TRINITY_DN61148_c0_g1~~TRINITY_DN61148_c0_g1_i1.p1  ORF type:complete len:344 (-),score=65.58 TRINITY_DN61148_c0_g1_i1:117-1148(-)
MGLSRLTDWKTPPQQRDVHDKTVTPPLAPPLPAFADRRKVMQDIDAAIAVGDAPWLAMLLIQLNRSGGGDPVHEAVRCRHLGALQLLLNSDYPADVSLGGCRPLHLAVEGSMTENDVCYTMADMLLQYGCRPDALSDKQPPLACASRKKAVATIELLLRHGADANVINPQGQTALHVACIQSDDLPWLPPGMPMCGLEPLPQLPQLSASSSPMHEMMGVDIFGLTPVSLPPNLQVFSLPDGDINRMDDRVIEILLRHEADPLVKDFKGQTPRDLLARCEIELSSKLRRAERWHGKCHLIMTCRSIWIKPEWHRQHRDDDLHSCPALWTFMGSSHLLGCLLAFL